MRVNNVDKMNLLQLVEYFETGGPGDSLYQKLNLSEEKGAILIFLTKAFGPESEIWFGSSEEVGSSIRQVEIENEMYYDFLDIYLFQELYEACVEVGVKDNQKIIQGIVYYSIYDAYPDWMLT